MVSNEQRQSGRRFSKAADVGAHAQHRWQPGAERRVDAQEMDDR